MIVALIAGVIFLTVKKGVKLLVRNWFNMNK